MDISMNEIDNITLSYFANKSQYTSILKKTEENNDKKFINDKRFYKKRVLDMTRRLFREEETNAQLIGFFNTYVKSCVNYLKFLDKSDIIQEKYGSMNVEDDKEKTNSEVDASGDNINIETGDYKNCDYLFSKPEDVKKLNLDTFVIKTVSNPPQKIIPKRENINIKTKEHKTKGIVKKKNIDNIYEDATNEN